MSLMNSLFDAWNHGDVPRFEAFLVRGPLPEPSETDRNGRTALFLAAWLGSTPSVERLVRAGGKLEFRCPGTGYTPLLAATFGRHGETVRQLVDLRADVNAADNHGQTPLMLVAIQGADADLGAFLITHGARVDAQDAQGNTALLVASARRRTALVKALLAGGAAVDTRNARGKTALMHAANQKICAALLEAGADPKVRDDDGLTAKEIFRHRPGILALLSRACG